MLKIRTDRLIILGLSARNLELLKQGDPIRFDGAEIGLPGLTFGICFGETEASLARDLGLSPPPALGTSH